MRLVGMCIFVLLSLIPAQCATVSIRNVSYPFTPLEVGNTVEVRISGAAPLGTVTVVQNGNPPYTFGSTDASGSWSVQSVETSAYIGNYHQVWYVNGIEIPPANPDPTYLPDAPRLPTFTVFANSLPSGVPPRTSAINSCGNTGPLAKWSWNPVGYDSTTSYGLVAVNEAMARWNSAQSKIPLQYSTVEQDILIYDVSSLPGALAGTANYSQGCNPTCYRYTNECTGVCLDTGAMYYSDILLNTTAINATANAMGASVTAFVTTTIAHEIGHSLLLDHSNPLSRVGRCSEVGSIMYPTQTVFLCGVNSPTFRDTSGINSIYPSSPSYCPLGNNYCGYTSCP